jgi:anti-sigma factor RsiW
MTPIEAIEISAYLDGELSPTRAKELEAALANDPVLRAEFAALARQDRSWRATATSANFQPTVRLHQPSAGLQTTSAPALASALIILIAVRVLPKLTDTLSWGLLLHGAALAVIVGWVIHMTRGDRADI